MSTSSAASVYCPGTPTVRFIPYWTRFLQGWLGSGDILTQPGYEDLGVGEATATGWQAKGADVEYRDVADSNHNGSVNNGHGIRVECISQYGVSRPLSLD